MAVDWLFTETGALREDRCRQGELTWDKGSASHSRGPLVNKDAIAAPERKRWGAEERSGPDLQR